MLFLSQCGIKTRPRLHQIYYRVHQRGFRVGHQNKDVSIQTKLVDPAVQLWRDVCPWATERKESWGESAAASKSLCRIFFFPCIFNWLCICVSCCFTCGYKLFTDVSQVSWVYPLTCLRAPNHLEEEHTWTLAKTHGQGSRRPDSHPCGEHEPAGLQSAEDAVTERFQKGQSLSFDKQQLIMRLIKPAWSESRFAPWTPAQNMPKNITKKKQRKTKPSLQKHYLDALLLIRAFRLQISFVFIGALHTQEAVGCVANPTGQHSVPQHGIHHCAFTITGPGKKQKCA